jgi:hypothetical protein
MRHLRRVPGSSRPVAISVVFPVPLLLLLMLPACGRDANPPAHPVTERDSAGVHIVEHRGRPPVGFGGWTVAPEPRLTIGGLAADEDHQVYRVRGAAALTDRSIVLANAGSGEIRLYSPAGSLVRSQGRKGGGPGEYQSPTIVGRIAGDTLVVGDFQNNRVSFVHPEAGFIRSFVANQDGRFGFARGALDDGTVLMGGGVLFGGDTDVQEGFSRQGTEFHLVDRAGEGRLDLGDFPGPELLTTVQSSGEGALISARSLPFSRNTETATGGNQVFIGTNDTYEIRRFDARGTLTQILRDLTPPPAITRSQLNEYARREAEDAEEGDRARVLSDWESIEPPATFPAFIDLRVDRLGNLWVRDFALPTDERATWSVFDSAGMLAARLALPLAFTVAEVGDDYILGVLRDEYEVESVQLLRLHRGSLEP